MFNVEDRRFPRALPLEPDIKFAPTMKALDVKVRQAPSFEELADYLPDLVMHTWATSPYEMAKDMLTVDKHKLVYRILRGKMLPTALNSINVVMTINNMSWHAVTHLTRHRGLNASADCSGDKDMNARTILYPDAFADDESVLEEFKRISNEQMEEYCRIRNLNKFTHVDARALLPRNMATFYTVAGTMPAYLGLIRDRKDTQVQPYEDNVLAYRVAQALWHKYPLLATIIKLDDGSPFYRMESQTNFASMFYMPEPVNNEDGLLSDSPDDYLFPCRRDQLSGDSYFQEIRESVLLDQKIVAEEARAKYSYIFDDLDRWR